MLTTVVSKLRVCLDGILNPQQLKKVEQAIILILENYDLNEKNVCLEDSSNTELITRFISAKKVEGCSARTLQYYETTIIHAVSDIGKNILLIVSDQQCGRHGRSRSFFGFRALPALRRLRLPGRRPGAAAADPAVDQDPRPADGQRHGEHAGLDAVHPDRRRGHHAS